MKKVPPEVVEKHKRRLLELRDEWTREYWRDREESRGETKASPEDLVEMATRSYARDYLLALSEAERKRLFLVENALGRIARGEYGVCSHCGARIHDNRLEAAPWACLCIVCQGLQEEGILPSWEFRPKDEAV